MRRTALALVLAGSITSCSSGLTTPPATESAAASTPSPAADEVLGGQIAYSAGEDSQIFLLDLATGESRQLTDLTDEDARLTSHGPIRPVISCGFGVSGLAWSPRGSPLAFTYGGCEGVLHVVDPDGTMTRIGDGRGPAWSPDGNHLVFSSNSPFCMGADCGSPPHPGAWNLQVADVDTGDPPVPLMVDEATSGAGQPTWSPDGTLIAFSGQVVNPERDDLFAASWVAHGDGSDARHLLNGTWPLGWLPDGRLLITDERTGIVHALDLDTGDTVAIGGGLSGPLEVSPDGERFVTSITDPATGAMGVQLVTIGGEVLVERPGSPGAWAPDSRAIAIVDLEGAGGIVILDRDGTELRTYALPPAVNVHPIVAWRPEG